ncbi:MAG: PIN domain-containing protein [Chitinispirillaceae bacterium]|nr:PIN domain-containing protein [Chitinispirillaceae bacterium]
MAALIHCDTHTAIWLFAGEIDRFSEKAVQAIDAGTLMVSPMVRLEMQFLLEIGRINEKPEKIMKTLAADFGIRVCDDPFEAIIQTAETIHWTRDPFDRIIVAHAIRTHAPLITKDAVIRKHYKLCVW